MFGTYRLILAVMVILSHAELHIKGINLGVIAVINFYIVSGYVMSALANRYYLRDFAGFYLDRAMRILPQYYIYLIIAVVVVFYFEMNPDHIIPTPFGAFAALTVLPLDFYMFVPGWKYLLVLPQSWSLGAEFCFYALVPLLVSSERYRALLIVSSLVVVALAFLTIIDTNIYGYRLIAGGFVYFGLGMLLERGQLRLMWSIWAILILLGALAASLGLLAVKYNTEVLIAAGLGLPVVSWLKTLKPNKLDDLLGSASYGAFLNHMIILWMLQHLFPYDLQRDLARIVAGVVTISLAVPLGWLSYQVIERPIIRLRRKLRDARRDAIARTPAADVP